MPLEPMPTTLAEAKAFVGAFHRHHGAPVGHKWSIGCGQAGKRVGVAVVGRPVAPKTIHGEVAEVTRLCTDGHRNACSFLYSRAARIAREMGYGLIQTFILLPESGVSLKAAGWTFDGITHSANKGWENRPGRKSDGERKQRWVMKLKP